MTRGLVGVAVFCAVLLAAILAGYWGVLDIDRLKEVVAQQWASDGDDLARLPQDPRPSSAKGGEEAQGASPSGATPRPESASDAKPSNASPSDVAAVASTKDAGGQGGGTDAGAGPVPETGAANAPPSFDIVRVEPDGSTVLAGRAPPYSAVRLLDGAAAIASQTASADGEFVIVLDGKLSVGEHEIRIEAKRADGVSVTSLEIAIVSIPEKGHEDQLLAMVEKPGAPSRLISLPAAPAAAVQTLAEAVPGGNEATGTPDGKAPADAMAGAVKPGRTALLGVEAVEIEDEKIFVAGRVAAGAKVRVYIDNGFLAEDSRLAGGRFLVAANAQLVPGPHVVRADALSAVGAVIARVEVPFLKPKGRTMSALSPEGAAAKAADAAGGKTARLSAGIADDPQMADAGARNPASGAPSSDGIAATLQPALESVDARVIIRRGDTLWRISRDTYGDGARYTVIYLANGDQIRDPDRIYPGQVFRMPKDAADGQSETIAQ